MLIFKNLKSRIFANSLKYFCNKSNTDIKFGLSNSGTEEEKQIGQNEKYREKFSNKTTKLNREEFLKREITSNPEFFKAFPHLANIVKSTADIPDSADLNKHIKENYKISDEEKRKRTQTDNYFETLM
jgi:hypothetical protein